MGQDYSIIVETTGNLPLDFALTYDNSNPDHQGIIREYGREWNIDLQWRDGGWSGRPSAYSVSAIHTYTLAVSWPEDKAGTEYTDEIDLVTLTVSSEQTVAGYTRIGRRLMMNKIRRKRQRAALMLITAAGIMLSLAGIAAARYMKQESQSELWKHRHFTLPVIC